MNMINKIESLEKAIKAIIVTLLILMFATGFQLHQIILLQERLSVTEISTNERFDYIKVKLNINNWGEE